jgi:hypothetical protein
MRKKKSKVSSHIIKKMEQGISIVKFFIHINRILFIIYIYIYIYIYKLILKQVLLGFNNIHILSILIKENNYLKKTSQFIEILE